MPKARIRQQKTILQKKPLLRENPASPVSSALPWYAMAKERVSLNVDAETKIEIGVAAWIRTLFRVCEKLSSPVLDPQVMEKQDDGSVYMRWQNRLRGIEVLVSKKDAIGNIFSLDETGNEYLASFSDAEEEEFAGGSVRTSDKIELLWRWLIYRTALDEPDNKELLSTVITLKEKEADASQEASL